VALMNSKMIQNEINTNFNITSSATTTFEPVPSLEDQADSTIEDALYMADSELNGASDSESD
jgi:hypothetical protein